MRGISLIMINLFKRLMRAIWSWSFIFKDQKEQKIIDWKIKRLISLPANWYYEQGWEFQNLIIGFPIESVAFCDRKINLIKKKIKFQPSIFFKDQQDCFAQGLSFLKIDLIDLLTINLFKRLMRVIWSQFFLKIDKSD